MQLALIGVGLIGGSFARAVRAAGKVSHVTGFDAEPAAMRRAAELGVIDTIATSAAHAVEGADLVMIATPVGDIGAVLREIAAVIPRSAIVTDVGSAKKSVLDVARQELGATIARFVPAHPIAGREHSGVEQSDSALFHDSVCITTPVAQTDEGAAQRVELLWRDVGCRVERMDPEDHDRVFAAVSHLPHLLAFALVAHIASDADAKRKFSMAGPGFRDFTRIAGSSPSLWSDICISNRRAIGDELRSHRKLLEELQRAIDEGDAEILRHVFQQAAVARRAASTPFE